MNSVIDEVLSGTPKYNIKDSGGTTVYSNVTIELATTVTTQGTPLNKALFDSIQSDLTSLENNKLNISSKATTAQAQAGTNDTNYMTAKKTRQAIQYLTQTTTVTVTGGSSASQSYTLVDVSGLSSDIVKVIITGTSKGGSTSNPTTLNINGTFSRKWERDTSGTATATTGTAPTQWQNKSSNNYAFRIEIDLKSKTTYYSYAHYPNGFEMIDGIAYGNVTTIGGTQHGIASTVDGELVATIQYIID